MNWALSLDFIVWSVLNITIMSSLYLIWCTGWGNILICPNSTIKKRKLEKIPLSEIGSISTLTAGSWDPQLSHPITWMLPVPLVSSIHALQPEDWAPDHWKYSFPKFTVFAFGLHLICNFIWYTYKFGLPSGSWFWPLSLKWCMHVHEDSTDQLKNYKTTHQHS